MTVYTFDEDLQRQDLGIRVFRVGSLVLWDSRSVVEFSDSVSS